MPFTKIRNLLFFLQLPKPAPSIPDTQSKSVNIEIPIHTVVSFPLCEWAVGVGVWCMFCGTVNNAKKYMTFFDDNKRTHVLRKVASAFGVVRRSSLSLQGAHTDHSQTLQFPAHHIFRVSLSSSFRFGEYTRTNRNYWVGVFGTQIQRQRPMTARNSRIVPAPMACIEIIFRQS